MRPHILSAFLLLMPAIVAAQSADLHPSLPATGSGARVAAASATAIDQVELVSPAEGAVVYEGTLRLVWRSVPFASQYEIQFSLDNFSTIGGVLGALDTTLSVPILAEHPRYWWRVRAVGFEDQGPFSEVRSFLYRTLAAAPAALMSNTGRAVGVTPNPAADAATIAFHLDRSDIVTIDLLDYLGRRVRSITKRQYDAGDHAVDADLTELAAGHYLYRLATSTSVATGALVVR